MDPPPYSSADEQVSSNANKASIYNNDPQHNVSLNEKKQFMTLLD